MRLVKMTALTPETSAFPGQLEADVQWEDVHAPSMMWREFLSRLQGLGGPANVLKTDVTLSEQ